MINMIERLLQAIDDVLNRLDLAAGDGNRTQDDTGALKTLQQFQ